MLRRILSLTFAIVMALGVSGGFPAYAVTTGKAHEKRDFRSELTGGMWHASPVLGSGWSSRLGLMDDSTFIYAASEMDGETRERFISGEWRVSSDGLLTLFCLEVLKWEGGEVVPAMASTGTETEIINAALVKAKYDPAKTIEIRVGDYVHDDSTPRSLKICLPDGGAIWGGDGWWWKYEGDWDLEELRNNYKRANTEAAETPANDAGQISSSIRNRVAADAEKETNVKAGQAVEIILKENQTTPYRWYYRVSNEKTIRLMQDYYKTDPNPMNWVGVGGIYYYYFIADAPGEYEIEFQDNRISDGFLPDHRELVYKLKVTD